MASLVASEDEVGKHGEQGVFITVGRAFPGYLRDYELWVSSQFVVARDS